MAQIATETQFTRYQVLVIAFLSFIQFTVILDFMVIAPLGAMLMDILHMSPAQFGWAVSAYAFSAGISGLLAAGFADRYDRKHFLLFFYSGFVIGSVLCGLATDYRFLLVARVVTGLFGGVMASVSLAIVTDLFPYEQRSRVMGFVQMSFAVSQIAGIPVGIYLANTLGWHAPFLLIAAMSAAVGLVIARWMQPVDAHIARRAGQKHSPFDHLKKTLSDLQYRKAFMTTGLLSIGGFLMMPFSSTFMVNNTAVSLAELPLVFMFTGLASIVLLPLVGKISDAFGKFRIFMIGTLLASVMVVVFTHLSATPFWEIVAVNIILFAGILSRMIPATALMTAVPEAVDRGAFMSVNASLQQISGGVASILAGAIVVQHSSSGPLEHYDILGYLCVGLMFLCIALLYSIHKHVEQKLGDPKAATGKEEWEGQVSLEN
jgi:predicted MFS family arabinose efflux permease